ncbi:MAG: SDR family oxidoreductase [Myxococcota bacterium]
MARHWTNKAVWITGGGSGIGEALAVHFAREGASVAVSGRREGRLAEVAEAIEAAGGTSLAVPCDVTEEGQVEAAVAAVVEAFGGLDVAIANAGFSVMGRVEELTAEDWRRQFDVNVVGAALTAKYAISPLRLRKGRLGLIGSVSGYLAVPKLAPYTASKFALRALGMTLRTELAGSGVSCTTAHPGFVESEIAQVDNDGVHHPDRADKRPQRLMWPTDKAAKAIADALWARRGDYVFTGHGKVGAFLAQHVPSLTVALMRAR